MFHIANENEIKKGEITDVYFRRGVEILKKKGVDKWVKGEVRASVFPEGWSWAVLGGVEEALNLLKDLNVNVVTMPEGTVFYPEEPVMVLEGKYLEFAVFETALLGMLCQASGIATKAARCAVAAGNRQVYSFGARRMHPAIAPMIERAAFIGGCEGVAVVKSAELIGEFPIGTMAHALIITMGSASAAYKAFDEIIDPAIKRVALVDTFDDEKFGALEAAETLKDRLFAVRLDTPSSRRGNFLKILQEVRWELDLRGFDFVKIFVSGGLDEEQIAEYNRFADAYGVGTAISNAPVIDFSFDLIEIEGKPVAKRGKMSGSKQVLKCENCGRRKIVPLEKLKAGDPQFERCDNCGQKMRPLLEMLLERGKIVPKLPTAQNIRSYVINQLENLSLD